MCSWGVQTSFRQYLLLIAVCAVPCSSACQAQSEPVRGDGGSASSEPVVVLSDGRGRIPVREASRAVKESADPLHKLVWDTREVTRRRLLSTQDHTPWQIMHGLLGLRQDLLLTHNGQVVNALEWIQTGPGFQKEPWFQKTVHGGRAHPYSQPYWFEGHINQFLAMLASCNLPLETKFGTPAGPITMQDMLKNTQMTVNSREEVTWTLWALCTYLPPEARWVNASGEEWSIEKLVQLETAKPVGGPTSPCGGTHGLFALARARNVYLRTGKPLRGVWFAADQKVKKYIEIARVYSNSDGSLSSGFFKTREYKQDFDKRMASQGHLLEFLMMSVSQKELKSDWVRRAINTTCSDLNANQNQYVSASPLFHAANALSIYLDRIAQEAPPQVGQEAPPRVALKPDVVPGGQSNPPRKSSPPRPPRAEGAGGIAPPVPPAAGNLQIPPPANAARLPELQVDSPASTLTPNSPSSSLTPKSQYPVPPRTTIQPPLPPRSRIPATSPPSNPPVSAPPAPPATTPGAPITNPRGVPVKSVSTSKSQPTQTTATPAPKVILNPSIKQPALRTKAAPTSSPQPPPVPPVPEKSPTPTAPVRPPATPIPRATAQPPKTGAKPSPQTPRNAPGSVSKTAGPADSEIMLLDDFLGSPPPDSSTPPAPAANEK
jgi:hypothetical protein